MRSDAVHESGEGSWDNGLFTGTVHEHAGCRRGLGCAFKYASHEGSAQLRAAEVLSPGIIAWGADGLVKILSPVLRAVIVVKLLAARSGIVLVTSARWSLTAGVGAARVASSCLSRCRLAESHSQRRFVGEGGTGLVVARPAVFC